MSEVLNAESVKSPDIEAKVNSYTGKAGDGRENNIAPTIARSAERRGRGESYDNRSKQYLSRSEVIRDARNNAYSGRDGYKYKEKPAIRRSSSRGGGSSQTSNGNAPGLGCSGAGGGVNSPSQGARGRRADDVVERRSSASNRSGRREEMQIRTQPHSSQGPPPGSSYEKKGLYL